MLSKHYAVNLGDMHAAKAFDAAAKAPADPTVRPADG
jgi:hypothetical protein